MDQVISAWNRAYQEELPCIFQKFIVPKTEFITKIRSAWTEGNTIQKVSICNKVSHKNLNIEGQNERHKEDFEELLKAIKASDDESLHNILTKNLTYQRFMIQYEPAD